MLFLSFNIPIRATTRLLRAGEWCCTDAGIPCSVASFTLQFLHNMAYLLLFDPTYRIYAYALRVKGTHVDNYGRSLLL